MMPPPNLKRLKKDAVPFKKIDGYSVSLVLKVIIRITLFVFGFVGITTLRSVEEGTLENVIKSSNEKDGSSTKFMSLPNGNKLKADNVCQVSTLLSNNST